MIISNPIFTKSVAAETSAAEAASAASHTAAEASASAAKAAAAEATASKAAAAAEAAVVMVVPIIKAMATGMGAGSEAAIGDTGAKQQEQRQPAARAGIVAAPE